MIFGIKETNIISFWFGGLVEIITT